MARHAGFSLEWLRRVAGEHGWEEVQCNTASRVIGFRRGEQRTNVYYTTRTVGTCLNHPRQGKTQLFRRGVSHDGLVAILDDPRVHTGKGYYRRQDPAAPEASAGVHADTRLWVRGYTEEQQDALLGMDPERLRCVALGYGGYMCVEDYDGEPSVSWDTVPRTLHNKLWGRQRELPGVDYVALSADSDNYFLRFTDGEALWQGPDSLTYALHERGCNVRLVVFAPDDGWFVQWADGATSWEGLPRTLHNKFWGRQRELPELEHLAVGNDGTWFARFCDGAWNYRLNGSCLDRAREIVRRGGDIVRMEFGEDSWLILYDEERA